MINILPPGVIPSRLDPIPISSIIHRNEIKVDRSLLERERELFARERELLRPVVDESDDMTPPRNYPNPLRMRTILLQPMDRYALTTAVVDFLKETHESYNRGTPKFPANETIRFLQRIGTGAYGNAYSTGDELFVVKYNRDATDSGSIHELFVGRTLSTLRDRTPIFSATLGSVSCSNALFNTGNQLWCRKGDDEVDMVIYEYARGVTASDFESTNPLDYFAIYVMILHGLQLAYDEFQFTHNDLHDGNVMIETLQEPMLFRITGNLFVLSRYVPRIIDYGFSRVTVGRQEYFRLYNNGQGPIRPNIILDAFRFFMGYLFKRNNSNELYNQLLQRITRMFTGYEDYFGYVNWMDDHLLLPIFDDRINARMNVWGIIETIATSIPNMFYNRLDADHLQYRYPFYQCGNFRRPACMDAAGLPPQRMTFDDKPAEQVSDIDTYSRYANWLLNNYGLLEPEEQMREKQLLRQYATEYNDEETLLNIDEM